MNICIDTENDAVYIWDENRKLWIVRRHYRSSGERLQGYGHTQEEALADLIGAEATHHSQEE